MEQRFKSLTIMEFQQKFSDSVTCMAYLAEIKWRDGYSCKKCGHGNYCDGKAAYSRQCTSCRYVESPTANTLFHRVRFDLLKAFYIVYFVSTNKKGITSTELSRKLGLRQKTCWAFKRKVMKAMGSSGKHPLEGNVEVDEFVVGGQESGTEVPPEHQEEARCGSHGEEGQGREQALHAGHRQGGCRLTGRFHVRPRRQGCHGRQMDGLATSP